MLERKIKIIIKLISLFWIINEIVQATLIFQKNILLNFFIIHLSSLYGGLIFCFLIDFLKLNKILFFTPIAIEILQSWLSFRCFDYWDLIFSLMGILIVILILNKQNNKLIDKQNKII
jgi:hypothetical protein